MNRSIRVLGIVALAYVILLGVMPPAPASAWDPACSPDRSRWYGRFKRFTEQAPLKGGQASITKTGMTTPGSGYLVLIANWTATAINVPNAYGAAWAEIGYGYNMIYPGHGPDWYYYYFRVDGSDGWYYPLSPNPSPDLTRHTIKIWWSSSNTYRGSVDDVEVMFATGLSSGTEGVYWHFVGAETNTCRSSISSSYISELKGQNWSGSWTSWLSGVIEEQAPANADWESQPLSGWVSIN